MLVGGVPIDERLLRELTRVVDRNLAQRLDTALLTARKCWGSRLPNGRRSSKPLENSPPVLEELRAILLQDPRMARERTVGVAQNGPNFSERLARARLFSLRDPPTGAPANAAATRSPGRAASGRVLTLIQPPCPRRFALSGFMCDAVPSDRQPARHHKAWFPPRDGAAGRETLYPLVVPPANRCFAICEVHYPDSAAAVQSALLS